MGMEEKMSNIKIVTDSTANLSQDYVRENNITVVPLNVIWGEESFKDGVDMSPKAFYERLAESSENPKTSQPAMQDFLNAYETAGAGSEGILAPVISGGISGTFASAQSAQQEYSAVPVEVVDTKATASGLALIVMAAVEAVKAGKSLAEVKEITEQVSKKVKFLFMVDTLEFLHRGGRIGGGRRFLGTALNIKPILFLDEEGKIGALEQVRTRKKALARLVELAVEEVGDSPARVGIFHANVPDVAAEFQKMLQAAVDCKYIEIFDLSPVIGVHVGPGTVGFSIYAE